LTTYHILGVMSGSSLDGIDYAMVRFETEDSSIIHWDLISTHAEPMPQALRYQLSKLPGADLRTFFEVDVDLGRLIGAQCKAIIDQNGIIPDAIASHGHTILHHPSEGYTVQIGNPAHIAHGTGCHVISDLRSSDVAAGGQGAPLAPVAERFLFPGYDFYLNLGGIANLSYFTKDGNVLAWDIAPANQLLNFLTQKVGLPYDNGGMLARNGHIHDPLIEALKAPVPLPLFEAFSLDNSWVQEKYLPILEYAEEIVADKLKAVTEFIALSIATQIDSLCPRHADLQLFVSGGGAHNTYLIERITEHIAPIRLIMPERAVIDFKEAMLMSVCGMLRLLGVPNSFASVTGATHDTINGHVTAAQRLF
jgi:anhydro-N-acetylmuramic acid kinase